MTYDEFNAFCGALKAASYVMQWGGSHVWKVGGKVFAIGGWAALTIHLIHILFLRWQVSVSVRRDGVEPPQPEGGWVTATGAHQCPADASFSL